MAKCVGQGRVPSGGRTRLARSDVLEDLGDERRVDDGGDDAHLGIAPRTLSQVNGEDPSQPLHPGS